MITDKEKTKPSILVADDEPLMRSVSVEILRLSGYDTLTADNGYQALEILRTQSVDLVITDVMMPEMNGIELLRRIREEVSDTFPVIIVSGSLLNAARSLEDAFTVALDKPFDLHVLLETIAHLIQRRRQMLRNNLQIGRNSAFA